MTEPTTAIRRLYLFAPLALIVVLAAGCGDDNKGTAAPKTPPSTTTKAGTTPTPTSTRPSGSATKPAGKATLLIGRRNLFPLLNTSIRRFAPTQAQGKSLRVVALASSAAFWAGRSRSQRILVTMRLKGGDPPEIKVGQRVDFVGVLTASGASAGALGVRNGADRTLLEKQGAYVDASAADVKLH